MDHNHIEVFLLPYLCVDIRSKLQTRSKGSKFTNKYGIKITGRKYNL